MTQEVNTCAWQTRLKLKEGGVGETKHSTSPGKDVSYITV